MDINHTYLVVLGFIYLDLLAHVSSLDLARCSSTLGMESGQIPDSAITASSTHHMPSVGPQNARIRHDKNGGAWCPGSLVDKESYEYLQIDFANLTVITKVEVQGRFGNGKGVEYATAFLLEYQRQDRGEWIRFTDKFGKEKFEGNRNTYTAEMREVTPPIIARRLRFIPFSVNKRVVCMRVEMHGCPWTDALVTYSVRQGDTRGTDSDFFDFTYDGFIRNNVLVDGLGQLTDGTKGIANIRLVDDDTKIKGYDWVGWRNDTNAGDAPVEITFEFENVRNFSSVIINANNYFSKNIRVFKSAWFYFSVGGRFYIKPLVKYDYAEDNVMEDSRDVHIDLNHTLAKFIKMRLFFDTKWIMISEVQFISEPVSGNVSEEVLPHGPASTTLPTDTEKPATNVEHNLVVNMEPSDEDSSSEQKPLDVSGKEPGHQQAPSSEDYISIIIGALAALIVILLIIVIFVIIRHKRRQNLNRQSLKPVSDTVLNNFQNPVNGKVSNGNVYNGVATEEEEQVKAVGVSSFYYEDVDDYKPPLIVALPPVTSPLSPTMTSTTTSSHASNTMKPQNTSLNALDKPPTYDALYAASDVVGVPNIPSLQGVSGNNVYAVPNSDILVSSVDCALVEFPRRNLRFVEVLGEGEFGEVHLCEAFGVQESQLAGDYMMARRKSGPLLVSVKILRKTADERARSDFHREMKVMSMLKDPNIVRVLGVCTGEEPLCMIVEYMKYGDLNQFLLEHVPETHPVDNAKVLSYPCLIYMASQIASGMKYLESLNMVHRDLATRNCLVGPYCTIKISDFGMSRSLYSSDYYRIEGRAVLPIRWMGWESILLGKFTTKSDVWSFAVTLWEILTFAREQPFEGLTDEQVISNAGHYYRNDNEHVVLSHPPICPKEIYDLMCECWNRQESERPSFREINMFLCRKNMGYDPRNDNLDHVS